MKKVLYSIILFSTLSNCFAGVGRSFDFYQAARNKPINLLYAAQELVDSGFYYSSVPLVKEYLVTARRINSSGLDKVLEKLINEVGIKQFEMLPIKILKRSKAPTIKYILAKKMFRRGKYKQALAYLNGTIPRHHQIKPFALNLEGSLFNFIKNKGNAIAAFKECISRSESMMGKGGLKDRQMEINRDFCLVGMGRVYFNNRKYDEAKSVYLDLSKDSYIWPEILFEEAWNSFYLKNYNRALGKLVTYKAPILSYVYNPEVEILNALTYFELCMWDDVNKTIERFYTKYGDAYRIVQKFLSKHRKDYRYYYLLAQSKKDGKVRGEGTLNNMLAFIVRDPVFLEMYDSFKRASNEMSRVDKINNRYQRYLARQLKTSLTLERDLIGAYVRSSLLDLRNGVQKSLEGMSSIKLEMLKQKKNALYNNREHVTKKRGNIRNLRRTSKQYFWEFNGEFWADELGDYVFSLKSRCEE